MHRASGPSPRRIVKLTVELTFDRSALRLFGETRNMSETGMLVLAEDPKPPGTPIRFKVEEEEFEGRAEVVWRREERGGALLGLKFTELPPRSRSALLNILRDSIPWN